jgi:hypothetical protein
MYLSDTDNWLMIIPRDVLNHIFALGDDIETIMNWVSNDMRSLVAKSRFTLREYGITYGYPNIIGWTINTSYHTHNDIIADEYLRIKGCTILNNNKFECVCISGIYNGHLEIVKWAYKIGKDYPGIRPNDNNVEYSISNIANNASVWGNISILQWAYEIDPKSMNMEKINITSIRYGHLEVFKWIITTGYISGRRAYFNLLFYGRTDMLQWMRKNDPNWNHNICHELAAKNSYNAHIIKWLDGVTKQIVWKS